MYFTKQFCAEMEVEENGKRTFSKYDLFIHDNSLLIGIAMILVVKAVMRKEGNLHPFATVE